MSPLNKYNDRLEKRAINSYDTATLEGKLGLHNEKFDPDGNIKPFYGLTCIVWVDQKSELYQELCNFQDALKKEFERFGLGNIFAFLKPESFHMTICDIDANSASTQVQPDKRIEQIEKGFQIGMLGGVTTKVTGVGLKTTITALVKFDNERELRKVLDVEHMIKQLTGVNVREFTGHISLAYFVQHPGKNIERIKTILLPYKDKDWGELNFSQFDLTFFTDMNTFIPILTASLNDGKIIRHNSNSNMLKHTEATQQ